MSHIHLVVPDLFLPQSVAAEACAGLSLPALETLLARSQVEALQVDTLEAWLGEAFGVGGTSIASITLRSDGLEAGKDHWLRADPVHLSMRRDQLILYKDVQLDAAEAAQFCSSLNEHFAAESLEFIAPHPQRWYLRLREAAEVVTTPLAQAEGRHVYEHLPRGKEALRWLGLFNEIQMLMHGHEVNQEREARGVLSVGGVWLWGEGSTASELVRPCQAMFTDNDLAQAFAKAAGMSCVPPPEDAMQCAAGGDAILVWDGLQRAWQHGEQNDWREEVLRLERQYVHPLLNALRSGRIERITLDVLHGGASRRFVLTRGAAWKLWRRPLPLAYYATN